QEKMQKETLRRVAFITGITGQDGSFLAELLLQKSEYVAVHGLIRRMSTINTKRIDHLIRQDPHKTRLQLHYGDLNDTAGLMHTLTAIKAAHPHMQRLEVYHLGAQSHVKVSFELPEFTTNVDGLGTLRLLEALRCCGLFPITRFYQAS